MHYAWYVVAASVVVVNSFSVKVSTTRSSSLSMGPPASSTSIADVIAPSVSDTVNSFLAFLNTPRPSASLIATPRFGCVYLMEEGVTIDESIRQQCKFDLFVSTDRALWPSAKTQLLALTQKDQLTLTPPTAEDTLLDAGVWSHFVSLTYPSIDKALPFLPDIRIGADAWELRVDLLDDSSTASLHRQIALLRSASALPIVFTVRSKGQIGRFPDDAPDRMFQLLREGVRAGAEWIDVEACWPLEYIQSLAALIKGQYGATSRILGSLHVTTPQSEAQVTQLFQACELQGAADMVKVVTGAASDDDCRLVHSCGSRAPRPYIGLALGAAGALSRVLNRRFTPVTHALMATAAPGQLTAAELMQRRAAIGLVTPMKYYLFGTPIKQSMSPAMHNDAYRALALPHTYGLAESDSVDEYASILSDASFGGASVTIPHKETIGRYLDEVSGAAREIGAVNTVAREAGSGRLVGYNTDWLGIRIPISRVLPTELRPGSKGLVVGAGGTARAACYALKSLGLELLVHSRSPDKGIELASRFGGTFVADLAAVGAADVAVVVSTVPAAAAFTLPANVLAARPVVLDVVYKPVRTPLVEQALANDCACIQGATMLLEQGVQQFEIWNGRRAPRTEMEAAVFEGIEKI